MTNTQIEEKANSFGKWYHEIELFPGFITPSHMTHCRNLWDQIRKVRQHLDYKGKKVLDLGTMDGLWAFEAEKLGATDVVAADIWQGGDPERFFFAKEALKSKVIPLAGANVHWLYDATTKVRTEIAADGFDIIQCLGLLYHVQNPLLALHEITACLNPNGTILFETATITTSDDKPWARFNSDRGVYDDPTTYWAPNWTCLVDWLTLAGLAVNLKSVSTIENPTNRVCFLAGRNGQPINPDNGRRFNS